MKNNNPFIVDDYWKNGVPPFDVIQNQHYIPALDEGIKRAKKEVNAIVDQKNAPDFKNTIVALEQTGQLIERVASVFFNLNEAETNAEMQDIAPQFSAMLTDYANEVNLNKQLFEKVQFVYQAGEKLTKEQTQLLEKTYKGFVRGGAGLQGADKERFKDISRQLSKLTLFFNKNVLAETNAFTLHIENEADLAGLPQFVVDAAHEEAKALGKSDWVFTLQHPSYVPFMQYADNRSLRETMYKAFATRGNNNNEHDNKETIKEIVNLRLEKARLFGYNSYADFVLEERMAQNAQNVNDLLQNLFDAGHSFALDDKKAVEEMARELGFDGRLERWDWGYYSEKLRKKQYTITDEMTKPYFELSNVIDAVFHLAEQLYGLTFKPASDVPVYHADVQVFNVFAGENERLQAVLYLDFHPRKGKGQGAWMTTFREQSNINGEFVCPLVSLVTNFTKPGAKTPSLLTFDEVTTFLHEFGHALHAMLSDVVYESLSCTNVYRDFVELPSQMHENWALEKEWLQKWACHYKTKEPIPDELIEKIRNARNFNSGYQNDRQISFGWVDMAWHTLTQPFEGDVVAFEKSAMSAAEPLPPVEGTAFCTAFGHIFAGGYAAGYYGYKWAEVLDADAFELFKEKGIFNQSVAKKFADTILKQGGSDHPMTLYKAFRGKEPSVEALLERSGLLKK